MNISEHQLINYFTDIIKQKSMMDGIFWAFYLLNRIKLEQKKECVSIKSKLSSSLCNHELKSRTHVAVLKHDPMFLPSRAAVHAGLPRQDAEQAAVGGHGGGHGGVARRLRRRRTAAQRPLLPG